MDFQVNDETYFLSLAENEKQWRVFVSGPTGAWPIPVYEDRGKTESLLVLEQDRQRVPN